MPMLQSCVKVELAVLDLFYFLFLFTSTEARWLIRDRDKVGEGGDERVKARPRIPPEKDRRDRGPQPEQWKC